MKKKLILEVIAALLVLLFLYACGSKWADFKLYINDTNNQPYPNWLTPWLVWTIPFIELGIAIGLAFERTRLAALYASVGLLTVFTLYTIAILLNVFSYVPCSCGGIVRMLSWPQHLALNLFFLALSVTGIVLMRRFWRDPAV